MRNRIPYQVIGCMCLGIFVVFGCGGTIETNIADIDAFLSCAARCRDHTGNNPDGGQCIDDCQSERDRLNPPDEPASPCFDQFNTCIQSNQTRETCEAEFRGCMGVAPPSEQPSISEDKNALCLEQRNDCIEGNSTPETCQALYQDCLESVPLDESSGSSQSSDTPEEEAPPPSEYSCGDLYQQCVGNCDGVIVRSGGSNALEDRTTCKELCQDDYDACRR